MWCGGKNSYCFCNSFFSEIFPNSFPNHCLATPKQVKLDIVAPVTNPPKNDFGRSNNCNSKFIVSNSINAEVPPCPFVDCVF